jgi:hypothetical protein
MIVNIAIAISAARTMVLRAHESHTSATTRTPACTGVGGPCAPALSIASTSSGVRSANKGKTRSTGVNEKGDARKWTTSRYSFRRERLAVVVTMTRPLAWTHLKITWPGVPPILCAIVKSTGSRGPPGYCVIGLFFLQGQFRTTLKREKKRTHARVPYASVTMSYCWENVSTSFHDA